MDAIRRAEQVLSAAGLRHPHVCLPGGASSPADRLGTMTLGRDLIAECDAAAKQAAEAAEATQATEDAQLQQLLQPDLGRRARRPSA